MSGTAIFDPGPIARRAAPAHPVSPLLIARTRVITRCRRTIEYVKSGIGVGAQEAIEADHVSVAPAKPGLSTEIIERTANGELGGEAKVAMDPGGLSCTFLLPVGPDIIVAAQSASEQPEKDAVEAKARRGAG